MREIRRRLDRVELRADDGVEAFDEVVLALHSDQALAMLGDPSSIERDVLGAIPYQPNEVVLHTDRTPDAPARAERGELELPPPDGDAAPGATTVTYNMNRLQQLDADRDFLVTLNRTEAIDPERIIDGSTTATLSTPTWACAPSAAGARSAAATAPTTAARTGAGASTRTASERPARDRGPAPRARAGTARIGAGQQLAA